MRARSSLVAARRSEGRLMQGPPRGGRREGSVPARSEGVLVLRLGARAVEHVVDQLRVVAQLAQRCASPAAPTVRVSPRPEEGGSRRRSTAHLGPVPDAVPASPSQTERPSRPSPTDQVRSERRDGRVGARVRGSVERPRGRSRAAARARAPVMAASTFDCFPVSASAVACATPVPAAGGRRRKKKKLDAFAGVNFPN